MGQISLDFVQANNRKLITGRWMNEEKKETSWYHFGYQGKKAGKICLFECTHTVLFNFCVCTKKINGTFVFVIFVCLCVFIMANGESRWKNKILLRFFSISFWMCQTIIIFTVVDKTTSHKKTSVVHRYISDCVYNVRSVPRINHLEICNIPPKKKKSFNKIIQTNC